VHTTKSEPTQGRDRRRKHSDEFKATVVAQCSRPGVSIARVALRHGLNANLLRKWVVNGERAGTSIEPVPTEPKLIESVSPQFVAVPIDAPSAAPSGAIEVELRRGQIHVKVSWPMSASAECGAWLRELLR
jgi:transposase-like protein